MLCSRLGFPTPSPTPARNPNQGLFDKFPELGHDYRRADNGEFEVDEKLVNELLAKRLHARLGLALTLALTLILALALTLTLTWKSGSKVKKSRPSSRSKSSSSESSCVIWSGF